MHGCFIGLCVLDIVQTISSYPGPNDKVVADATHIVPGGPATNAALTFRYLGGEATLYTNIGSNPVATLLRIELEKSHLRLIDCADPAFNAPVATAIVSIDSAERSVVSGINRQVVSLPPATFVPSDIILIDGHYADISESLVNGVTIGAPIVLDGGSWKPQLERMLPRVSVAICSERFVAPGCGSMSETAAYLKSRGVTDVAFTRGEKDILLYSGSGETSISVPQVHAVDTLGAGDVFHGAFCWDFARNKDLMGALSFAASIASHSCTFSGPFGWMEGIN